MMFTGKTKSGFTYCIPEKRIQNMELLDALTELETNGAALPKVVNLLLDANAKQKLYDHVRWRPRWPQACGKTAAPGWRLPEACPLWTRCCWALRWMRCICWSGARRRMDRRAAAVRSRW